VGSVVAIVIVTSLCCFVGGCFMRSFFLKTARRDMYHSVVRHRRYQNGNPNYDIAESGDDFDAEYSEGFDAETIAETTRQLSDDRRNVDNEVTHRRIASNIDVMTSNPNMLEAIRAALRNQIPRHNVTSPNLYLHGDGDDSIEGDESTPNIEETKLTTKNTHLNALVREHIRTNGSSTKIHIKKAR